MAYSKVFFHEIASLIRKKQDKALKKQPAAAGVFSLGPGSRAGKNTQTQERSEYTQTGKYSGFIKTRFLSFDFRL